jgi:hypothetical protein
MLKIICLFLFFSFALVLFPSVYLLLGKTVLGGYVITNLFSFVLGMVVYRQARKGEWVK